MNFIQYTEKAGNPIYKDGQTITPISKVLEISIPGTRSHLVWNRPTAFQVKNEINEIEILPVIDATRQAQFFLLGIGLIVWGISLVLVISRRRNS